MGKFNRDKVAELLVSCHRRCCICHRFCGVKMETDHIVPSDENGTDKIDNAIPVCLECHAEIHCYNPTHPRGRKFTETELRGHKKQWLSICENKPEIFAQALPTSEVGPLNSLVDELEYNLEACERTDLTPDYVPTMIRELSTFFILQSGRRSVAEPGGLQLAAKAAGVI